MTLETSLSLISKAKSPKNYTLNTHFNGSSFRGHYLNYFIFTKVEFHQCDFREVDARLAVFHDCLFVACSFDNANFQFTEFTQCRFLSNQETVSINNASFGGARIERCAIYNNSIVDFTNSSLRNAIILDCTLGKINAKDSSLEMSEIRRCSFAEFDISYASTSGCILQYNDYLKVKLSTACFFQMVGSNTLLTANSVSLVNYTDGGVLEEIHDRTEIILVLEKHLETEIRDSLSLSRAVNGLMALLQIEESKKISISKIGKIIAQAILKLETPCLQIIDELCGTLKTLNYYEVYSKDILSAISAIIHSFNGEIELLHPQLRVLFETEFSLYKLKCEQKIALRFSFRNASISDALSVKKAINFLNGVQEIGNLKRVEAEKLSQGSLLVELLALLEDVPLWVAGLTVIGLSARIKINFDLNVFGDQIGRAVKSMTSKTDDKEKANLASLAEELDVHIVVVHSAALAGSIEIMQAGTGGQALPEKPKH